MLKEDFIKEVHVGKEVYGLYDIMKLEERGVAEIKRLPFSIRVLVENLLRKMDGNRVKEEDLRNIAGWKKSYASPVEIPHHPMRVLMQDFTGVPAVVDLAAMRETVKNLSRDPKRINPLVPTGLVIDHSLQVDYFGTKDSLKKNVQNEYKRNRERYELLKWAQKSFDNLTVIPPGSGTAHMVNLEYFARVIEVQEMGGKRLAYPDSLIGTDSHTPMINSLGILGWGVGGIEAEAVMLGQPYYMTLPQVVGVKLVNRLNDGITATDLVLTITELLRRHNVVEKFVEFFGPGMKKLSFAERATISNMTPEYGATIGFFPVDEKTIDYLRLSNRGEHAELVEICTKELGLFYYGSENPDYSEIIELDLSSVQSSVAGHARPQDRKNLLDLKREYRDILRNTQNINIDNADQYCVDINGREEKIGHGSIVVAALTSCTNTSNPFLMMGAGLVAKNAVEKGLRVPSYVKTSLTPGTRITIKYLDDAGLLPYLEALGFHVAGYGCATCIGNSGPIHPEIEKVITEHELSVACVISGNRNFEARIHQKIKGNFLASPPLVVAFALAGQINMDLVREPLAYDPNGAPVYLRDIWPKTTEVEELVRRHVKGDIFREVYDKIFYGDEFWRSLPDVESATFQWDETSTYIKRPPYFDDFNLDPMIPKDIEGGRVLVLLGESVTTDHISPAGAIPGHYPAGKYLTEKNVSREDFNSYGSRRGNDQVMTRGTFGNIRLKNRLVGNKEGGLTRKFPEGDEMHVYDASVLYAKEETPLLVLAGKEYGTGSSRDWAAKGTSLLGVKAVLAGSFERIHRSNLVGMGVLPLVFHEGESWESLGLQGDEKYSIRGIEGIFPRKVFNVLAERDDGDRIEFQVTARLDSPVEVDYFINGGILPFVLRSILK